jgi:hypothetical protein
MANTFEDYTVSTSTTDFNITFEYLEESHIVVEIDGVLQSTSTYSIVAGPPNLVRLNTPVTSGVVRVKRDSDADSDNPFVDFVNGSVLNETELDKAYRHNLYLNEEIGNLNELSLQKAAGSDDWDAKSNKIINVADPTLIQDASTKNYVDTQISNTITGSSDVPPKTTFTGTGSATVFTFASGITLDGDTVYEVAIDGVLQEPTAAYTIDADANTITFTSPPALSANIVVVQRGYSVPITTGTVTTELIVDGSVTADKLDSSAKDRSIFTGTQTASTISDFDTEVSNNASVAANTAKVTNATHTGDVTGSTALTIANNAVTGAKISSTDTEFNVNTNVGIGAVASGTYKLEVAGDIAATGSGNKILWSNSTDGTGYLILRSGGEPANARRINLAVDSGTFQMVFVDDSGGALYGVYLDHATGDWAPFSTGIADLGQTTRRWDNVWSNGTFNGSDRNLKEDIQDLDEAEKRVAVACKSLVKKYRLKSAVEKKGDAARTHVGIIAQELQAAFEAEGLDPFKYSMIGRDTWYEKEIDGKIDVKKVPTEGYQEVTQMSVQYTELLAFIISAL